MIPSSSPAWAIGATRVDAEPSRPTNCGSQTSSQVPPLTPARAMTGSSLVPIVTGGRESMGDAGVNSKCPPCPVHTSADTSTIDLRRLSASWRSSSSIGIERVNRWPNVRNVSSGATRSPYTSRLARSVSQRRRGQVQQRCESSGDHRQQEQCAFVIRGATAEAEDHHDVDGDDQHRQPGEQRRCG